MKHWPINKHVFLPRVSWQTNQLFPTDQDRSNSSVNSIFTNRLNRGYLKLKNNYLGVPMAPSYSNQSLWSPPYQTSDRIPSSSSSSAEALRPSGGNGTQEEHRRWMKSLPITIRLIKLCGVESIETTRHHFFASIFRFELDSVWFLSNHFCLGWWINGLVYGKSVKQEWWCEEVDGRWLRRRGRLKLS